MTPKRRAPGVDTPEPAGAGPTTDRDARIVAPGRVGAEVDVGRAAARRGIAPELHGVTQRELESLQLNGRLLVSLAELPALLGRSARSIRSMRRAGRFPAPALPGRRPMWSADRLRSWAAAGCPAPGEPEDAAGEPARPRDAAGRFAKALRERGGGR